MAKRRVRRTLIEEAVMLRSQWQCCMCMQRGDQLHHLDGDSSNTTENNLVFLCVNHHAIAGDTSVARRRLTPTILRKARATHYARVAKAYERTLQVANHPIKQLSQEDLILASATASGLVAVAKASNLYWNSSDEERSQLMWNVSPYAQFQSMPLSLAVLRFVTSVAYSIRFGLSQNDCYSLTSLATKFLPEPKTSTQRNDCTELVQHYLWLAEAIVYDAAVHLRAPKIALPGLELLRDLYEYGHERKWPMIMVRVRESLSTLKSQLERADRPDLGIPRAMIEAFVKCLAGDETGHPEFPAEVRRMLD